MGKLDQPGYPLPDGELGEDEIVCQLIYLPDRAEYWQALLAAIQYFSTWKAWQRDDDKRGKDAAANWREAFELTIGCWRMTCLEDLITDVNDILELMQTRKDCCDDNITYLPTEGIETEIIPNQGEPPEYYGETEVEDWDEWLEHLCYHANKYVDYLAHAGDQMWEASKTSSLFIGLIAALLSLLAFSGIGLPIAFGVAVAITSGIVLTGTIITFEDTEESFEDARNEIVCAIISGRSLADAVETALESGVDWTLFYQFIDYASAVSIMYNGGDGDEIFLETEKDDTCACTCLHFESSDPVHNPVIYQSAAGAQFTMSPFSQWGYTNFLYGGFSFNNFAGSGVFCGPFKHIDTITVSDGLKFTYIHTHDQDDNPIQEWGWDTPQACNYNISLMQGEEMGVFVIQRNSAVDDGCDTSMITVTLTYHDV